MISIKGLKVGQLDTNCYLLSDSKNNTIIIDPGDSADYIENIISDCELTPKMIIATHGHFDHIMGAFEIQEAYNIPFFINREDIYLVKSMKKSAAYFLGIDKGIYPPRNIKYLKDRVSVGNLDIEVIHTPGHTPGSVLLYLKSEIKAFCGDLIFKNNCVGRYDFSYSSLNDLKMSVKKALSLPSETEIYPGHYKKFILSDIKDYLDCFIQK